MNDVVFRRIKGRIVPISKKKQKEAVQGAAVAGSGVAVAAGGGRAYKKVIEKAVIASNKAALFGSKFSSGLGKATQVTFEEYVRNKKSNAELLKWIGKSSRLEGAARAVRIGSKSIGAGLIAVGSARLAGALSKKEHREKAQLLGASAGAAATTAFMFGFKPSVVIEAAGSRLKNGLFRLLKARF